MARILEVTLTGTAAAELPLALKDETIIRIEFPASWTPSAIAAYEAYGSTDSLKPLWDDEGVQVLLEAGAGNKMMRVDERLFQHARRVAFASVVSQGGSRVLRVQVVRLTELAYGSPS